MVKFLATKGNDTILLGLGITEGNIDRLKEGRPMHIKLDELRDSPTTRAATKIEVLIFYGRNEESIKQQLASFIGPETVIVDSRPKHDHKG